MMFGLVLANCWVLGIEYKVLSTKYNDRTEQTNIFKQTLTEQTNIFLNKHGQNKQTLFEKALTE